MYSAVEGALASGFATADLHHAAGHDPGAQWRHLPDEYGKWNSVFRRYRRWVATGVFDALLETRSPRWWNPMPPPT
ncbi:MAG: transposase [Mesorhizobium sp.]|uniref:transposase n=1 Tax=Mesorhizobium sp. TaxID=1871066 RepID=UPI000FE644BE|nr:MAG: transposase [Mesorhizobium sp.]RWD79562.1 MAG: transposase [Mesorhizobium sp.]RWD80721.1 MAG: transposase [Mesorhizobium sp.]TJW66000.1 MAG: transposase [Mesorhizobium sp.]